MIFLTLMVKRAIPAKKMRLKMMFGRIVNRMPV
jgi:hypothetical protein